jgi:hypothetical protein
MTNLTRNEGGARGAAVVPAGVTGSNYARGHSRPFGPVLRRRKRRCRAERSCTVPVVAVARVARRLRQRGGASL